MISQRLFRIYQRHWEQYSYTDCFASLRDYCECTVLVPVVGDNYRIGLYLMNEYSTVMGRILETQMEEEAGAGQHSLASICF